jgi:hypothetical protein
MRLVVRVGRDAHQPLQIDALSAQRLFNQGGRVLERDACAPWNLRQAHLNQHGLHDSALLRHALHLLQ